MWGAYYHNQTDPEASNVVDPASGECPPACYSSGREEHPRKRQKQNTGNKKASDEGKDDKLNDDEIISRGEVEKAVFLVS